MPQELRVKHLYSALIEIQEWIASVTQALGSLDPERVVPADSVRCVMIDPTPTPDPASLLKGVCGPPRRWPEPPPRSRHSKAPEHDGH